MPERKIKQVENNTDKQRTYRTMLTKYRMAMKYEFYLEALIIDYAMIEDRLIAFIYHAGFMQDRERLTISGKGKNT